MDVTFTFDLNPAETRRVMRSIYWAQGWPALAGLPVGLTGLGLLLPRLEPGAAAGWAELSLLTGLCGLAAPYVVTVARLFGWRYQLRGTPRPASLRLTDERLRIERDDTTFEYPWRYVTKTTEAAGCYLIFLRPSGSPVLLPRRAIPPELQIEVADFLREIGTGAPRQRSS